MKKIVLVLITILSVILLNPVYAENRTGAKLEDNSGYTNLCKRDSSNNYGVNKRWDMSPDNRKDSASKTPCVNAKDKVYDFSDILTASEENTVKSLIEKFSIKNNIDVVFVSYNLPYTNDEDNDNFAADFYDYNDFGMDYYKYDGIIIFRNTYDKDPYFYVGSFGEAQLYLYSSRIDTLVSGLASYIKNKNYTGGIDYTLDYYEKCVRLGALKGYKVTDKGYLVKSNTIWDNIFRYGVIFSILSLAFGGN